MEKQLIYSMKPKANKRLIDVACGTGDIAKLFVDETKGKSKIHCVDPNKKMLSLSKIRLKEYKNIYWKNTQQKNFHLKKTFDYYTISFGLRNTKNISKALSN